MKNKEVIKAFINNRPANSSTGNLSSTCGRLFSYTTCIAEFIDNVLLINRTKYSVTTSRHQYMLDRETAGYIKHIPIYDVPRGSIDLKRFLIQ